MKKILLLAFIFVSLQAAAQKSFFGVDGGINVANQRVHVKYFNQYASNSYSNGSIIIGVVNSNPSTIISTSFFQNIVRPSAGIFYHFAIKEKMGVRFKAQYLALGYKNIGGLPDRLEINYLYFPITFHYSITSKLSVGAGPYLSFTLGGTKINNQEITRTYHKNDNGLTFGLEYDIYKNLSLGTYYVLGLKNIWLNDNITQPFAGNIGTAKYTNRALQFTVIYKLKKIPKS